MLNLWNSCSSEDVLGSLIIDPEAITFVVDLLRPQDFYRNAHQIFYETIMHLYQQHEPADFITLCDVLERLGKLEDVGGPSYITSLISGVPTSGNIVSYAQIVAHKALCRSLIHAAGEIAAMASAEETNALEMAESLIFSLSHHRQQQEMEPLHSVLSDCMTDLDALHSRQETLIGVPTGFRHLDIPLGGLQPSDLIILAARPGTGKTAFALNIAFHAAYQFHRHVAFFSLEMSKKQVGFRLLSMKSHIDQQRLRMGWVHCDEWESLLEGMSVLCEGPIWVDETSDLSLAALRSKARRLQTQPGIDLIVVDYLQLMQATLDGKRYANREQEIAEINRGLKGIAKELNVPMLALAQLSRAVENRQSKVLHLSDLRESGAIENDADVVLFIYREEMYDLDSNAKNTADIIIAKHRNGPVGSIRLGFEPRQTRFYSLDVTSGEV